MMRQSNVRSEVGTVRRREAKENESYPDFRAAMLSVYQISSGGGSRVAHKPFPNSKPSKFPSNHQDSKTQRSLFSLRVLVTLWFTASSADGSSILLEKP